MTPDRNGSPLSRSPSASESVHRVPLIDDARRQFVVALNARFGDAVYHEFKKNGTVAKRFLTTKKMTTLLGEIEQVDKEILRIGKELDKMNKD